MVHVRLFSFGGPAIFCLLSCSKKSKSCRASQNEFNLPRWINCLDSLSHLFSVSQNVYIQLSEQSSPPERWV